MRIYVSILISFFAIKVRAELRSLYGFGPTSAAVSGADRAKSYDGYAIMQNPALMSDMEKTKTSAGFFGSFAKFKDVNQVVTNNTNLGGSRETGNFNTSVPDTFLFQIGTAVKLGTSSRNYRLGIGLATPLDKVASIDSKDYYTPQYALYQSDSQRVVSAFGFSFKPTENWSVGLAGHIYVTMGATVNAKLPQTPKTTTANSSAIAKPALAPALGTSVKVADGHTLSAYYVVERDYRLRFNVNTSIYLVGAGAPINLSGSQSLFYDPETFSLGYAAEMKTWDLLLGVDYERWSKFDGQLVKLEFSTFQSDFSQTQEDSRYHDIVTPRVGAVFNMGENKFRIGYAYRPSPTPDLSGVTNFLDSNRHILGLGYSWKLPASISPDGLPLTLDTHTQIQYLETRTVQKNDPNAIGAPATPGGPGYSVGGFVFSYGFSLTAEI